MKKLMFASLILLLIAGFTQAQDEPTVKNREEKKIILKIVDEDGKITTKVIEDGEDGEEIQAENIWITESGDSINIEIEVEDGDGIKTIHKKIHIPGGHEFDFEGLDDLEDIEKHIEIFGFDDEEHGGRHPFLRFRDNWGPHGNLEGEDFFFYKGMDGGEKKAKLGVSIEDHEKGVKVTEVFENSAAYSVGILAGDIITSIDDKKMTNTEELIREVSSHKPGDFIEVELRRNGKKKEFDVRLNSDNSGMSFMPGPGFPGKMFMKPQIKEMMKQGKAHCKHIKDECMHLGKDIEKEIEFEIQEKMEEHKEKQKEFQGKLEKNLKDKEKFMHKLDKPLSEEDEN